MARLAEARSRRSKSSTMLIEGGWWAVWQPHPPTLTSMLPLGLSALSSVGAVSGPASGPVSGLASGPASGPVVGSSEVFFAGVTQALVVLSST